MIKSAFRMMAKLISYIALFFCSYLMLIVGTAQIYFIYWDAQKKDLMLIEKWRKLAIFNWLAIKKIYYYDLTFGERS